MGEPGWNNHKETGGLFEYLFSHWFNSHLTFQQTFRYEESKANFSYATSFQPQTGTDAHGNTFKPTKGTQYEAGLKYKPRGFDALFTASAFHIDQTNVLTQDPDNPDFSIQSGKVTSKGFEVSAQANVTKDLRFIASYTYDDARYSSSNDTAIPYYYDPTSDSVGYHMRAGTATSLQGKYVNAVPRNMTSLFVNYALPRGMVRGLEFNFGVRYVGWTYANTANSFKVPAFILFDTGMRYDFGEATAFLKGLVGQVTISNLTNKYYITSCATTQCYIGQGRRVYGNLSYRW